jgi:signal transduction histidine kinase
MTGPRPVSGLLFLSFGAKASEFSLKALPLLHRIRMKIGTTLYFSVAFVRFHPAWARLLYFAAAFPLVWLAYHFAVRRIEMVLKARFQQDLARRIRDAHDLHDTLLQTIEASRMIADDALDAPADSVGMLRAMRRLSDWLGQATQEGQDVLNLLRTSSYGRNDLAVEFRRFAEKCLFEHSVDFALSVTGETVDMNPIIRDEVYSLGCEAIRNACKCPDATYLRVALTNDRDFHLRVQHDGKPIEPFVAKQSHDGHFDLREMQDRAERFGAALSLFSSPSSETELILTVPGEIIFQRAPSFLPTWLIRMWSCLRSSGDNSL